MNGNVVLDAKPLPPPAKDQKLPSVPPPQSEESWHSIPPLPPKIISNDEVDVEHTSVRQIQPIDTSSSLNTLGTRFLIFVISLANCASPKALARLPLRL